MANKISPKDFRYYIVTDVSYFNKYARYFRGHDLMFSLAYLNPNTLEKNADVMRRLKAFPGKVMVDSGGFSNFNRPGLVTFERWRDFMKEHGSAADEYVAFDDLRSRAKTMKYYEEAIKAGLDPLFVDHLWFSRRPPRVDELWKQKDKLCIAGFAKTKPNQEPFPGDPKARFEEAMKRADEMDTHTHLLAVGSLKRFLPHIGRIHSVDSAAWVKRVAFGAFSVFRMDKLEDVKVPVLTGYSCPGASKQNKPIPSELKAKVWDNIIKANGWENLSYQQKAELMSLYHTKKYVEALRKFDPAELKKALAEKNGKSVQKMLDDDEATGFEFLDLDPLDPETKDFGWTVSARELGFDLEGITKQEAASPKMREQASNAKQGDQLTLGEFFFMPKPTRPAFPEQPQTIESLINLFKEHDEWFPTFVQKKYDGARHQIHRDGEKVLILSEDGGDNTARLPRLVEALKELPVSRFVLDAELERWDGRQHLPREAMSSYLASRDTPDDSDVVANVFDLLFFGDEGDIHKEPARRRLNRLLQLKIKQSTMKAPNLSHPLNLAPGFKVNDLQELEKVTRIVRELPGSEGIVAKQAESTYPLEVATPDSWVKYHNATLINGIVTGKLRNRANAWTYRYGIMAGDEKPAKTVKAGEKEVVPVGDTFNTSLSFDVGDPILVEAETLNIIRKPEGVEVTAWVPRVIGEHSGDVDDIKTAAQRAKRDLVLQEKKVDESGEVSYVQTRKREKQSDPYMEIPSEDEAPYRFVVHEHWRGKSVHSDVRVELRKKELLIGWTLNTQIEGEVKEPVTSVQESKEMFREHEKDYSKIDWTTGEWKKREREGASEPVRTNIVAERKAPEPYPWIDVEGKTKEPEEGKAPPVGGTRQYPGVFNIVDQGLAEYGAQKPWFHEYFFQGDALNYRVIFRKLKLGVDKARHSHDLCMRCKKAAPEVDVVWAEGRARAWFCKTCFPLWKAELGGWAEVVNTKAIKGGVAPPSFSDVHKALPPSEPEAEPLDRAQWLAIYPDDQRPYVLDPTEKDWMPPLGVSALPKSIRSQVPEELRYWKKRNEAEARKARDELVQALEDEKVKLDFAKTYKASIKKASLLDAEFVLQEQSWKGPKVVREGPSERMWWLRIDAGRPKLIVVQFPLNPLDNHEQVAYVQEDGRKASMSVEGDLRPGHYMNPTKDTPSHVSVLDSGKAQLLSLSDDFIKMKIEGKSFKGLFALTKRDGEWSFEPTEAAPETTKKSADLIEVRLGLPIQKVDSDKRLVTGVVLEPNEVDAQNDTISPEVIERACHKFTARYNEATKMGLMHKLFGDIGVLMVESWIAPQDFTLGGKKVKKGSWIMTVFVESDALWAKIKRGEITGFSIGGVAAVA